jgi:hypothetical protein
MNPPSIRPRSIHLSGFLGLNLPTSTAFLAFGLIWATSLPATCTGAWRLRETCNNLPLFDACRQYDLYLI